MTARKIRLERASSHGSIPAQKNRESTHRLLSSTSTRLRSQPPMTPVQISSILAILRLAGQICTRPRILSLSRSGTITCVKIIRIFHKIGRSHIGSERWSTVMVTGTLLRSNRLRHSSVETQKFKYYQRVPREATMVDPILPCLFHLRLWSNLSIATK